MRRQQVKKMAGNPRTLWCSSTVGDEAFISLRFVSPRFRRGTKKSRWSLINRIPLKVLGFTIGLVGTSGTGGWHVGRNRFLPSLFSCDYKNLNQMPHGTCVGCSSNWTWTQGQETLWESLSRSFGSNIVVTSYYWICPAYWTGEKNPLPTHTPEGPEHTEQ